PLRPSFHATNLSFPVVAAPPFAAIAYLFFLIMRPPPRSTLFPYTTLFRSARRCGAAARRAPGTRARRRRGRGSAPRGSGRPGPGDRKSTRLNSSHVAISYAVFCLKKKNEFDTLTAQWTQVPVPGAVPRSQL